MEKLIQHMRDCGWTMLDTDEVFHPCAGAFPSWEEAIKVCIEVAPEA